MPEYGKRDNKAPKKLICTFTDEQGNEWGKIDAKAKDFSSGSVGFYANGKIENPDNDDCRYQVGASITLIGSKPKKS